MSKNDDAREESIDEENNKKIKKLISEREKLKLNLKSIKKKKKILCLLLLIISIMLHIVMFMEYGYSYFNSAYFLQVIILNMATLTLGIYVYFVYERRESNIQGKIIEYESQYIQQESGNDIFENSIKMSYKYLDQYYMQTKEQAQKGFAITVIISVFGAGLIAIGIVTMFLEKTDPSYIACGSGVVVEFISAIFFYLYNKTVSSMSNYHNKLVLSHNISIALKVSDSLSSEDKTKAKNIIINELLKDINTYLISSDINTKNNDYEQNK